MLYVYFSSCLYMPQVPNLLITNNFSQSWKKKEKKSNTTYLLSCNGSVRRKKV